MSREIDALVAEKVMGWWSVGIDTSNMLRKEIWADGKRKIYGFNPSEDIAAAWMVVEAMKEKGYGANIVAQQKSFMCFFASVYNPKDTGISKWDKDAPMAICKAALECLEAVNAKE